MLRDFETFAVADASGSSVKIALVRGGETVMEASRPNMAMEGFASALAEACGSGLGEVGAFALCVGPGSMLSTRVASCALSTVAALTGAKLFSWDAMQVAAAALHRGFVAGFPEMRGDFRIVAPSRKGYANVLDFRGGCAARQEEVEIGGLDAMEPLPAALLDQRAVADPRLAGFKRLDLPASAAARALLADPGLAELCALPPEPKSLSKREYVKWKVQARI